MLDGVTLDQLRTFVTVVDEGSFSAAGRRLQRVQSAVSHAMAGLEAQLGVRVWDRSTKIPTLTPAGAALLGAARRVLHEVDALGRVAEGIVGGLEPCVALAVDSMLPSATLVDLCRGFAHQFPSVQLRVFTDTLSAVSALVMDGQCQLGVVGPAADTAGLERRHLAKVLLVPVVAAGHPLAELAGSGVAGPIPTAVLAEHVAIVLSERGSAKKSADQAVLSPNTWRVADLATKHALLCGGLGWGNLPMHMIEDELAAGTLVRLQPAAWAPDEWMLSLSVVHRPELAPGVATRWLLQRLSELCRRDLPEAETAPAEPARRPSRGRPRGAGR